MAQDMSKQNKPTAHRVSLPVSDTRSHLMLQRKGGNENTPGQHDAQGTNVVPAPEWTAGSLKKGFCCF